jgi:hypothetical protein
MTTEEVKKARRERRKAKKAAKSGAASKAEHKPKHNANGRGKAKGKGKGKKKKGKKGGGKSYKNSGGGSIGFHLDFQDPVKVPMHSEKPKSGGSMRVRGTDFLSRVTAASTTLQTVVLQQQIHPLNGQLFSNLLSVAQNFREYKFHEFCVMYVGKVPVTDRGALDAYIDEDPAAAVKIAEQQLLNFERAHTVNVFGKLGVKLTDHKWLFTDQSNNSAADQRLQQAGKIVMVLNDTDVANYKGHIWCSFDVEFKDEIPLEQVGFSAALPDAKTGVVADGVSLNQVVGFADKLWEAGKWVAGQASNYLSNGNGTGADLTELNAVDYARAIMPAYTPLQIELWTDVSAEPAAADEKRPRIRHNKQVNGRNASISMADAEALRGEERKKWLLNEPGEPTILGIYTTEVYMSATDQVTGVVTSVFDNILNDAAKLAGAYQDCVIAVWPPPGSPGLAPNPWVLNTYLRFGQATGPVTSSRTLYDSSLTVSKWATDQLAVDDGSITPALARVDKLERQIAMLVAEAQRIREERKQPCPPPRKRLDRCFYCGMDDPDHIGRNCPRKVESDDEDSDFKSHPPSLKDVKGTKVTKRQI